MGGDMQGMRRGEVLGRAAVGLLVACVLLVLLAVALLPLGVVQGAGPDPVAGPTPVSVTRPAADGVITFDPFSARVVTGDVTSGCVDVGRFAVVDALYQIDQTDVNTVTLTTRWSIDGVLMASGVHLVTGNAADATDLQQVQVFGRFLCVLADVTNASPVTITVQAIAK